MSTTRTIQPGSLSAVDRKDSANQLKCAALALLVEMTVLTGVGYSTHWMVHEPPIVSDDSRYIEAQMLQLPEQEQLVEDKPAAPIRRAAEPVLSKRPEKGQESKQAHPIEDSNQTASSPHYAPTHGPVAIFAPAPVLPSYLQNQNLRASVVIDFYVSSLGHADPRLVGSSGNQELDALALKTAKLWKFSPAENNHHPLDAKVRLRIVFEVK